MRILCFLQKKKDSKNYPHLSLLFPKENNKYSINVSRRSSKISLSFLSTNTWFLSLHNPPPPPWNNNKYIKACELLARRVSKFPVKRYIQCWAGKIEQFFRILFTTAPSPSHSPLSLSLSPFRVAPLPSICIVNERLMRAYMPYSHVRKIFWLRNAARNSSSSSSFSSANWK